jgi:type IV secretory pathway TraG/TraD family ATPase VirD4
MLSALIKGDVGTTAVLGYVMTSVHFEGARYIRSAVRVVSTGLDMAVVLMDSPLICAATEKSDFDIRDLRRKPMSIFIGSPLAELESYRPLVPLLFQQIHDVVMRELPGADELGRSLAAR